MLPLRVSELRWEAEGVLSLGLVDPSGGALPPWTPGAHLDVELRPGLERQYSLCGALDDDREWRLAVLLEPHGRGGSAWVHERLRPGDTIRVRGPRNHFELVRAEAYEFIAGGIGITPILPMLAAATVAGSRWRLLYGGRRRASMAFVEQLASYGERVAIVPEDDYGLLDVRGAVAGWKPGTLVYCCGPAPLLDAVEQDCAAAEFPAGTLHVERFTPRLSADAVREGGSFDVHLERSGLTVHVAEGQTILEAVEAAGVAVACSCLEGTCGTCETTVLDGDVDHRDSILTDEERAASETMMICVSRARSPALRLDL
jgi:ferredoxin-NADP reductase